MNFKNLLLVFVQRNAESYSLRNITKLCNMYIIFQHFGYSYKCKPTNFYLIILKAIEKIITMFFLSRLVIYLQRLHGYYAPLCKHGSLRKETIALGELH